MFGQKTEEIKNLKLQVVALRGYESLYNVIKRANALLRNDKSKLIAEKADLRQTNLLLRQTNSLLQDNNKKLVAENEQLKKQIDIEIRYQIANRNLDEECRRDKEIAKLQDDNKKLVAEVETAATVIASLLLIVAAADRRLTETEQKLKVAETAEPAETTEKNKKNKKEKK